MDACLPNFCCPLAWTDFTLWELKKRFGRGFHGSCRGWSLLCWPEGCLGVGQGLGGRDWVCSAPYGWPWLPWKAAASRGSLCTSSPECPRIRAPSAYGALPLPCPCGDPSLLLTSCWHLAFLLGLAPWAAGRDDLSPPSLRLGLRCSLHTCSTSSVLEPAVKGQQGGSVSLFSFVYVLSFLLPSVS